MKRSEILKFLEEKGREQVGTYAWYYIDPETVLDLLEEAGMIPPKRDAFVKQADVEYRGKDIYTLEKVNEWEPEDT